MAFNLKDLLAKGKKTVSTISDTVNPFDKDFRSNISVGANVAKNNIVNRVVKPVVNEVKAIPQQFNNSVVKPIVRGYNSPSNSMENFTVTKSLYGAMPNQKAPSPTLQKVQDFKVNTKNKLFNTVANTAISFAKPLGDTETMNRSREALKVSPELRTPEQNRVAKEAGQNVGLTVMGAVDPLKNVGKKIQPKNIIKDLEDAGIKPKRNVVKTANPELPIRQPESILPTTKKSVSADIQNTNPEMTTINPKNSSGENIGQPSLGSNLSSDNNIPLLPTNDKKLLPAGRPNTPAEAKRIYKKTGEAVDFVNVQKPGKKPIVGFAQGQEYATKLNSNGNEVPMFDKTGNLIDKNLQDAIDYAIQNGKDKPLLSLNNQTPVRNIEDIFGHHADTVKAQLTDEVAKNEASRVKWVDSEIGAIKKEFDSLGLKINSKEDQLAHRFAEKRMTIDELQRELPNTWQNVVGAANITRTKYDQFLDQINEALTRNGYAPVPKREDYITHLNELNVADNMFGGLFNIPKEKLPSVMSMIHTQTKPGRQWFKFGQKRQDGPFVESVINALDAYIPAASKQIYHTDTAQKARTFEKVLQAQFEKDPQQKALANFAKWTTDYVNHLTGKSSALDRSAESIVGKQIPAAIDWLKRRSSANQVGANIASAMTNFIPLTQSIATTSKISAGKGLVNSWNAGFKEMPNIVDGIESSFLTRRFGGDKKITSTIGTKMMDSTKWLFGAIDKFVANSIVSGKYYEGLKNGLSKYQAMKVADDYAARVIGDRSFGQMPTLYNSKMLGVLTQYQLEVNNQLSFIFKDIPKMANGNKLLLTSMLGQVALYGYIYNTLFEKATGRRPALDPIDLAIDTVSTIKDEDMDNNKKASNIVEKVSNQLPYSSTITGGGRLPITSVLPDPMAVLNGDSTWGKEAKKVIYGVVSPTGGGQAKKTIEGINAYNQGASTTDKGNVRFPIEKNIPNAIRTTLFGQYSTQESKEYFDKSKTPLSKDQSEKFNILGNSTDYYNKVMNERSLNKKSNKEKESLKTGNDKIKSKDLGNGLNQLSNGKFYSQSLDQEFKSEKDARKAIAKDNFDKSGQKFSTVEDTFYYRDKNDEVQSKPISEIKDKKYELDYTLGLEKAKDADDYKWWKQIQTEYKGKLIKEYEGLDENNPLDALRMVEIENKVGDINRQVSKFDGYGGSFKKGKKIKLYNPLAEKSTTAQTYRNLQQLLAGTTTGAPRSGQIGRKVQLRKIAKG